MPFALALVGIGKIARDQHIPSIAANPDFTLAATVSRAQGVEGVPGFKTLAEMKAAVPSVQAIAVCTPPMGRLDLVREAASLGLHVLMEKPPAATLTEAETMVRVAADANIIFYQTWHSREAAGVEPAKAWLTGKTIRKVSIAWKEDVRVWHPGQEWIWEPGIGVFDPGINALSVISKLLDDPMVLSTAELRFPENKAAPIAASLAFTSGGVPVGVEFDFDQKGPQTWDIDIETDSGALKLSMGASKMAVDGKAVDVGDEPEYFRLYRRFAECLKTKTSDADLEPFRLVADSFMLGRRVTVGPFA